jgi:hypothetical protein
VGKIRADPAYEAAVLFGRAVADRVGHICDRGARIDRSSKYLSQKVVFSACGILRRELDFRAVLPGPLDAGSGTIHNLLLGHVQLVIAMNAAGRDEYVYSAIPAAPQRVRCHFNILRDTPGQGGNSSLGLQRACFSNCGPLRLGADGEASLYCIDAEFDNCGREPDLISARHRDPWCLLTVAQRGIQHADQPGRIV